MPYLPCYLQKKPRTGDSVPGRRRCLRGVGAFGQHVMGELFSMGITWGITQLSRLANLNQLDMDFFYETLPNFANLI